MSTVDPEPLVIGRQTLEEVYGESPKERAKPPHHLLETQIFPNLHKNETFQVEPEQLSFIMQHKSKSKKLRVINTSASRQNFHVIEPINHKVWSISYKKPDGGLVPGGNIEINVKFICPHNTENNSIYQDSIRLHCSGGNLLIPLYAYPTIDTSNFPSKINFGSVPLGQETIRTITLTAPDNESFDYSCTMHPPSDTFHVHPSCGTIQGNSDISVFYRPTEFITSSTNMQIIFSTFDRKMLKCKINGNCLPGLLTLKKKKEFALKRKEAKAVSIPGSKETSDLLASMVREKSNKARLNNKKKQNDGPPKQNIPKVIPGAQHHVNKILNSADKDAKKKDSHDKIYLDRSKVFRDKLRQSFEAEKINKLRWQIRLGDEIPTFDELESVRQGRNMEYSRIGERTEREANSLPQYTPNFDPYRNSPWRARHVALGQFQQAARTILIRIRAEDRLSKLRKLMKLVNQDGLSIEQAEASLLAAMGRQIQRKVNGPSEMTPFVHDSSSSATQFNRHESGKMNGDSVSEEPIPTKMHNGESNDPSYFKTLQGNFVEIEGFHPSNPYAFENKVVGKYDLAEEGVRLNNYNQQDVLDHINQIKNLSMEKMSYNEIMGIIKPKTRLTNSAHHIELPVETPPDTPEPEEAPEETEDSFDDSKVMANPKRESSMLDRVPGARQSNMRQSRMSLQKRTSTAKNIHHD